ncbi:MAG: hypothetical protein GC154_15190 [bacterium]|nr:hypothetical protein [bacterium]
MFRIVIFFLLIVTTLCRMDATAGVLDDAANNIERIRKGDVEITLKASDGSPLRDVTATIEQTSHAFAFGNYIRLRHYNDEQYLNRFKELFNYAELLEFNWGQYEPDEGEPLFEPRMDFIKNWCYPNGLRRFYGHMLVWTHQYGEYPRSGMPMWLFQYSAEIQHQLLMQRIAREVNAYKDIDITWDVVNEAIHCRVWGDWDKDSYIQNKEPEPMDRIVRYVSGALNQAHQANPAARLMINDYSVIPEGRFQARYQQLIEKLRDADVPLDAIGIQAHEPYKGKYWYSPEELWNAFELFGTRTGLPILITEYVNVSDPGEAIRGSYKLGNWSPEAQADAIEEFYRAAFGHPSVEGIVYFGMSDADVVMPKCGLFDEQFNPKPAWNRLKHLIQDEWTTRLKQQTNGDGTIGFRGFYGTYTMTVRVNGKTIQKSFEVKPRGENRFSFIIPEPQGE